MSVNLQKGSRINLSKQCSGLKAVNIGLGWDPVRFSQDVDCDAWVALYSKGKLIHNSPIIYFKNLFYKNCIIHHGDNLTGVGDGDDEVITILLNKLPSSVDSILVGVTVYRGFERKQSLKNVKNLFARIVDADTNIEIAKFTQKDMRKSSHMYTFLAGKLYKENNTWSFHTIGNVTPDKTIEEAARNYKEDIFMPVNLSKGNRISLKKVAMDAGVQSLTKVVVGLGWDTNRYDGGAQFDLDACAFLLGSNGKIREDSDFVFYGSQKHNSQGQICDNAESVIHTGDNRTGDGDGDDEQIIVDLTKVPASVERIAFTVTIDQADQRKQNFGMVENSMIHIMDAVTGTDLVKFDLGEDFSAETAIIAAEIYRHNGEWQFNAIGSGFNGGLEALCANYGVTVE